MSLRSKRIQIVIDLARRKLDAAAAELQQQQQALQQARNKQSELNNYYQHYTALFAERVTGIRAKDIGNSRLFLQEMSNAIALQGQQVILAEKSVLNAQSTWHHCYLKVESLLELQQRYSSEEQLHRDKQEQKLVEEWVTARQSQR